MQMAAALSVGKSDGHAGGQMKYVTWTILIVIICGLLALALCRGTVAL